MSVAVDGAAVFDTRGTSPVLPASNMKLVAASVALAKLGPNYRFTTTVMRGPDGTLYLVGGGDPLLFTQAYLDAAQRAAASPQRVRPALRGTGGHPHTRRAARRSRRRSGQVRARRRG